MGTILDVLADSARERVALAKETLSLDALKEVADSVTSHFGEFAFEKALTSPRISFICECKKASPSKGIIVQDYPYLQIAQEYERAGADCVSVLTEPTLFMGSNGNLRDIASVVKIPCLRKDFTVDEYMVYEAKILGASAVLLIVSILDDSSLSKLLQLCNDLGLSALVETHDEKEVSRALRIGARVIGVNNRNLKDFSVDMDASLRLRDLVGDKALFVAESGIKTSSDVVKLRQIGVDAILVGETLMRATDKRKVLSDLRGCSHDAC